MKPALRPSAFAHCRFILMALQNCTNLVDARKHNERDWKRLLHNIGPHAHLFAAGALLLPAALFEAWRRWLTST